MNKSETEDGLKGLGEPRLRIAARNGHSVDDDLRDVVGQLEDMRGHVKVDAEELRNFLERARQELDEQRHLVRQDALTQLANRRALEETLEREIKDLLHAKGRPLSLLMFDIDYFKKVNDTYNHLTGDKVLCDFAELLTHLTRHRRNRSSDLLTRYGGEEFVCIARDTNGKAVYLAERLRRGIEVYSFHTDEGRTIKITSSIGVSTFSPNEPHIQRALEAAKQDNTVDKLIQIVRAQLIKTADVALMHAKRTGRNRVSVWDPTIKERPLVINWDSATTGEGGPRSITGTDLEEHK